MSRRTVDSTPERELVVGWDPPLGTYFGQVNRLHPEPEEEECLAWCGYQMREITDLDALSAWCERQGFAALRDDVRMALERDRAEPWEPGPLQRAFGFIGESDERA